MATAERAAVCKVKAAVEAQALAMGAAWQAEEMGFEAVKAREEVGWVQETLVVRMGTEMAGGRTVAEKVAAARAGAAMGR